jgi:threonyl-tRNA synthetase
MVHRHLMQQLDLAHIEEHSPGMVFWHPKGWKIYTLIQNYIREIHEQHGYSEVSTPILMNKSLWEVSGHWGKFKENMFTVDDGEKIHAIKPMSCPNHIELYRHTKRSYKELPIRYFEFGIVHRNEPSGSMHGLMRVRKFTQDDCHIICRESQILQETINYIKMVQQIYKHFGFNTFTIKLSTRPQNHFGSSEMWDKTEKALADACDAIGLPYEIQPFEAAFYGPKLEMTLVDSHGKNWQCGTIQLDYLLPSSERFNLKYINDEGIPEQPVILHHAILGSIERWIGILLEQTEGKLPFWLAPIQTVVVQISEKSEEYSNKIFQELKDCGLRVVLDNSNDTMSSKIAIHSANKVPYILVVGEKEAINETVSVRSIGERSSRTMTINEFKNFIKV